AAGIAIIQPWAPVCANAAGLLPYSDLEWTAAANHEPAKTAAACEKNRTRKVSAALETPATAEAPEAPRPEPAGTLPVIFQMIRGAKDSAAGFVRAGNDSK